MRQAITFGAPVSDTGNVRTIANTNNLQFGPEVAGWAQAVAFGTFDAATNRTGLCCEEDGYSDCILTFGASWK